MKKIITKNSAETKKFGFRLAKKLKPGDVLALVGDLGTGKTTFVQGLAQGLGIKNKITSPSFVRLKIYPVRKKNITQLCHFDFYRQNSVSSLEAKEFKEYLKNKKDILIIEWADKIKPLLPRKTMTLVFQLEKNNSRIINLNKKIRIS